MLAGPDGKNVGMPCEAEVKAEDKTDAYYCN